MMMYNDDMIDKIPALIESLHWYAIHEDIEYEAYQMYQVYQWMCAS